MEFVNGKDDIHSYYGKQSIHVWNHQPDIIYGGYWILDMDNYINLYIIYSNRLLWHHILHIFHLVRWNSWPFSHRAPGMVQDWFPASRCRSSRPPLSWPTFFGQIRKGVTDWNSQHFMVIFYGFLWGLYMIIYDHVDLWYILWWDS